MHTQGLALLLTPAVPEIPDVPAWAAALLAVAATVLVRYVDRRAFSRVKGDELQQSAADQIREDLMGEMDRLRTEIEDIDDRLDKWRERYFRLRHAYNKVEGVCKMLRVELMIVRKEITSDDLHKLRLSATDGRVLGLDAETNAAINGGFDNAFLDETDREVEAEEREQEERRRKPRRKKGT